MIVIQSQENGLSRARVGGMQEEVEGEWPVYEMLPRARSWGLGQGSKWATDNSLVAGEGTQPQEMALFSRILALAGWVKMKQTW